jgi:predicted RNA-binding protein YlqC (UPF0109 family)
MNIKPGPTLLTLAEPTRSMLLEIAGSLLGGHPDVSVETMVDGDDGVFFILRVPALHLGRLIGPDARTAESLRVIVGAAGIKLSRRFSLSIASPAGEHPALQSNLVC